MRKDLGRWKKAAFLVVFAGVLSVSTVPVSAAETEETAGTTDITESVPTEPSGDGTDEKPPTDAVSDSVSDSDESVTSQNVTESTTEDTEPAADLTDDTRSASMVPDEENEGEEQKEGWIEEDGYTRYYVDGKYLSNKIREINGSLYAFDTDGDLIVDTAFSMTNPFTNRRGFHRAKENGVLYRSEWYESGSSNYYYTENGIAPQNTLYQVDGVSYYFAYSGYVEKNSVRIIDDNLICSDRDGVASSTPVKEGWITVTYNGKEEKLFIQNKEIVKGRVLKIGTAYYGFSYSGFLYTNQNFSFSTWDEAKKESYSTNYRARKNGTLYLNSWYNNGFSWYYYGAEGKGAKGPYQVKEKWYLFNDYSCMLTNSTYNYNGTWYAANQNGIAAQLPKKNGWYQRGTSYYYIKNGEPVTKKVLKIGKAYYGFGYDGVMMDDTSFGLTVQYENGNTEYHYYRAKAGGKLYVNEWYAKYSYGKPTYYYYGKEGASARGLVKVGKFYYYFDYEGQMAESTRVTVNDLPYAVAKNGHVRRIQNNTFTKVGDDTYYAINNECVRDKVIRIGNAYYGFDSSGKMYDDTTFTCKIYDEDENYEYGHYRAKKGGKLYTNAWYGMFYYGADGRAPSGLLRIKGKTYYFNYTGEAQVSLYFRVENKLYHTSSTGLVSQVKKDGFYYITADRQKRSYVSKGVLLLDTWKVISKKTYYFNENGESISGKRMIKDRNNPNKENAEYKYYYFRTDGSLYTSTWIENKFYAKKNGELAVGMTKLGGKQFYFDEYGELKTGVVKINDDWYLFDSQGILAGKLNRNGWTKLKGDSYYLVNGEPAGGLVKVGNAYYYFSNGRMLTNTTRSTEDGNALFNASGKRVESGWYSMDGNWYYVSPESHEYVSDTIVTIKNKDYLFDEDGHMYRENTVYNGKYYQITKDGVIKGQKELQKGWTLAGGSYYFAERTGKEYNGWKGDYYIHNGRLLFNAITPDGYYVGETGKYQKKSGWITQPAGEDEELPLYMYVKKGGKVAKDEWLSIGKKWYYFSSYYAVSGTQKIDGVWYIFDQNCVLRKTLGRNQKDGWLKVGNDWYLIRNHEPSSGTRILNGKTYYLGYNENQGKMFHNEFGDNSGTAGSAFYMTKGGTAALGYSGWKKIGGVWYYFESNGRSKFGWVSVKGKYYYIEEGTGMVTGYKVINEKLYYFDKNGVLKKSTNVQNGWHKAGGSWYFFENGRLVTNGIKTIKGKVYLFDEEGKLCINGFAAGYHSDKNGVILRNTWRKVNNQWKYFGNDGVMLEGIYKIGKKVYYFSDHVSWN